MKKVTFLLLLLSVLLGHICCGMEKTEEKFEGNPVYFMTLECKDKSKCTKFFKSREGEDVCFGYIFPCLMFFDLTRLEGVNKTFKKRVVHYKDNFPLHLLLPARMYFPHREFWRLACEKIRKASEKAFCGFCTPIILFPLNKIAKWGWLDEFRKYMLYPYYENVNKIVKNSKYNIVGLHTDIIWEGSLGKIFNNRHSLSSKRNKIIENIFLRLDRLDEPGFLEEVISSLKDLKVYDCYFPPLKCYRPYNNNTFNVSEDRFNFNILPENLCELIIRDKIFINEDDALIKKISERFLNLKVLGLDLFTFDKNKVFDYCKNIYKLKKLECLFLILFDSFAPDALESSKVDEYGLPEGSSEVISKLVKKIPNSLRIFVLDCNVRESYVKDFEKISKNIFLKRNISSNKINCKKYDKHFIRNNFLGLSVDREKIYRLKNFKYKNDYVFLTLAVWGVEILFGQLCTTLPVKRVDNILKRKRDPLFSSCYHI